MLHWTKFRSDLTIVKYSKSLIFTGWYNPAYMDMQDIYVLLSLSLRHPSDIHHEILQSASLVISFSQQFVTQQHPLLRLSWTLE